MDFLHSHAPGDEELLNFALDGEDLSEEAKEHLKTCEICQQRLASYQKANNFLVSHLYRRQCPTGTKLSYYCAGLLHEDERISIAAHLLDCPLCAAEAADTRRFLQMQDQDLLFASTPSFPAGVTVQRIFATLIRQQAQFVMRSDDVPVSAWPRQYKADSLDLSLHLSRATSGEYMLLGILTSADPNENVDVFEGMDAELYKAPGAFTVEGDEQAEMPLLHTLVDDIGNIVFSSVPVGEYVMVVHLPGRDLVIDGLKIEHG